MESPSYGLTSECQSICASRISAANAINSPKIQRELEMRLRNLAVRKR